ncbi:hypothetical protein, partial [Pseudomonas lopnurensis]|uniref:hypothetical protein n=1 Tax=Pseudomonas lopnurensis TaxID=1477517 RepID=UPI001A9C5F45
MNTLEYQLLYVAISARHRREGAPPTECRRLQVIASCMENVLTGQILCPAGRDCGRRPVVLL